MESRSSVQDNSEDVQSLKQEIERLKKDVQSEKNSSENVLKRLQKAEFERDSSKQYAESLKEDVRDLSKRLAEERSKRKDLEKLIQNLREKQKDSEKKPSNVIVIEDEEEEKVEPTSTPLDLASELKFAAEQAVAQSSFVYDGNTGLYYDWSTGYYYDPNTCLYYNHKTGTYYYYDGEKQTYIFHSQVDLPSDTAEKTEPKKNRKERRREKQEMEKRMKEKKNYEVEKKKKRKDSKIGSEEESEDGEIKGSESEEEIEQESDNSDADTEPEDFPPCIRAIVLSSSKLQSGSLTIFTCLGGTIGREKGRSHLIRISDVEVSKDHAQIMFNKQSGQYYIKDLGSQNGTFINENRLSQAKVESDPVLLMHGDVLRLGDSIILLHIHEGTDTCDKCEPGQVQAELAAKAERNDDDNDGMDTKMTQLGAEARRRKELKKIKQMYFLENTDYSSKLDVAQGGKYKDRADTRRVKVGSDAPVEQPDDAPSSVHRPIASTNKGRRLLEKMGWKDGEGLGKESTGRKDPVLAEVREGQRGLGSGIKRHLDNANGASNSFHWDKARERFKAVCLSEKVDNSFSSDAGKTKNAPVDSKTQLYEDIFAD